MNQSAFAGQEFTAVLNTPEDEVKFAELMVQAFLDPAIADRYASAPSAVLGEFGLSLGADAEAPALPQAMELGVVREDFTDLGPAGVCLLTFCWTIDSLSATGVEAVAAAH
jgi:putative thiazole/oxazole-modified microcin (TOMM)-like peptide